MQFYFNEARENDPHALPDGEVFFVNAVEASRDDNTFTGPGWYWWHCFPGCLPDSDACGPFDTEEAAHADAMAADGEEEDE